MVLALLMLASTETKLTLLTYSLCPQLCSSVLTLTILSATVCSQ